jgi:glycosyltransferase involved in cell wall biosynthesis
VSAPPPARSLRIAFITPEFVTESSRDGGLANFVNRLTQALLACGHQPDVFTLSKQQPTEIDFGGVRVYRTWPRRHPPLRRLSQWLSRLHWRLRFPLPLPRTHHYVYGALALGELFNRWDRVHRYDLVHTSDYGMAGLFVPHSDDRVHVARSSSTSDLFPRVLGRPRSIDLRVIAALERRCLRRADVAYAPSETTARHYADRHRLRLNVVRPPFLLEARPAAEVPADVPPRYMLHFGTLGPIKGTDWLAATLPHVWAQEPEFALVLAGKEADPGLVASWRKQWGTHAGRVFWLGSLRKPDLYAVLRGAVATILPSRCDNFPNTALESLALGVPVIGTNGASLDELVEPGGSGELVPVDDVPALADVLLRAWRGEVPWVGAGFRPPRILEETRPELAVARLLELARVGQRSGAVTAGI